ncbi:MAG TPA: hypothetical protein PKI82_04315 [Ruminococcus flavefaciens]|nr:hypothetical protein [Ruminococcus flavefaciens]
MKEDILTKALEQALDESYNEMIDQDIPDYAFSPEFEKKMNVLIQNQMAAPEKRRRKIFLYPAAAAAAALICVTAGIAYNHRPDRTHETANDIITKDEATTSAAQNTSSGSTVTTTSADKDNAVKITTAKQTASVQTSSHTTSTHTSEKVTPSAAAVSTAKTVPVTAAGSSAPPVTTVFNTVSSAPASDLDTAVSSTTTISDIDDTSAERSYYMKKISAFLAAFLASQNITLPVTNDSNANDIKVKESSPFIYSYYYNEGEMFEALPKLHENESVLDVNKDGIFDIEDVYIMYSSWAYENFKTPEKYDFSGLRKTEINDEGNEVNVPLYDLIDVYRYFATYRTVKPEHISKEPFRQFCMENLDLSSYRDEEEAVDAICKDFLDSFTTSISFTYQFYDMFRDKIANNEIDIDLNSDGVIDFGDYCCYNDFQIPYTDPFRLNKYLDSPDKISSNNPDADPETIEKCVQLIKALKFEDRYPMLSDTGIYILQYYMEDHPYNPEWSDDLYYQYLDYYIDHPYSLDYILQPVQYNLGYGFHNMRYCYPDTSAENIAAEYETFKKSADSGKRKVPDLNSDGLVDVGDFRLAFLFFDDYRYMPGIPFPEEYRQSFLTDFDLNDNGMNGDINDLAIYQMYISDLIGGGEDEFRDELIKYYKEHPGFDAKHAAYYLEDSVPDEYQGNIYDTYNKYLSDIKSGKKEKPDINMDGKVDMEDFIEGWLTMLSYRNNYGGWRMSLVSEETQNRFLESFDPDGDGNPATWDDENLLQLYVGDILGYDIMHVLDSEVLIDDAEYYISRYDDILPEDERTIYWTLDPETTKNMTRLQKEAILNGDIDENDKIKRNLSEIISSLSDEKKDALDINRNGQIDNEDFHLAHALKNLYFRDIPEDEALTDEIKEFFFSRFDFNDNGLYGDFADYLIADKYYESNMVNILPDEPAPLPDGHSSRQDIIDRANKLRESLAEEKRNGDANIDGNTDISDSVIIMQFFANPSKYNLTDKGKFNGDIFATGDGITPKDALEIQKILLFNQ